MKRFVDFLEKHGARVFGTLAVLLIVLSIATAFTGNVVTTLLCISTGTVAAVVTFEFWTKNGGQANG